MTTNWKPWIRALYSDAPVLTIVTLFMAADLLLTAFDALVDHTVVTGMPVWIKPIKFAISSGIYSLSLALIVQHTHTWKRALRNVDLLTGLALVLEIVLIDLQAFRHTTSHFNNATPFDRAVYATMGIGIATLWICALIACIATFRNRYSDRSWGVVARAGMLLVVLGSGTGAFMTRPTPAQIAQATQTGKAPAIVGGHTVGASDGQPGMPLTGWNLRHGDVRIPHFVGLHGLQLLALLALILRRLNWAESRRAGLLQVAALSYGTLFTLLLWQALRGEPLLSPSPQVRIAFQFWLALTLAASLTVYVLTASRHPSTSLAGESR